MRKLSIFIWGIAVSCLISKAGFARQPYPIHLDHTYSTFQAYLIAAGLENVQIQISAHKVICISFENRRYRNEIAALGIVLRYAVTCFPFADNLVLIPKYRNIPLKYIQVPRQKYLQFLNNEISAAVFIEQLTFSYQPPSERPLTGYGTPNINSSFLKLDLVFSPGFNAQFARPGDPIQLQLNLVTDLSVTLANGLQCNGQGIIPFYNEFQSEARRCRLGQFFLNHFFRGFSKTFVALSAGLFESGCCGFSTQIRHYLWNDCLSFTARLDYLKNNSLDYWLPLESPCENRCSYLLQVQYRFDQINFETRLTWGRYLLGDEGWRIDIVRTFHELELGFMGVWNESLEFLTGMTVRIPFPISRQLPPGRARISTPRFIPWNYRYLPCFDGCILNIGTDFEDIAHQYSKSFIRSNIDQLKNAIRYVKLIEPDPIPSLVTQRGK